MYQYDKFDHQLLAERNVQFRDQVARRLSGELSEEEFRPLRLMNGLYLQLHAYMLRVAVPYGLLSSAQLRQLAYIARRYDRDYGHFTTRQNIQYNWIKLEEMPDLLDDLAKVEMHAIQTSGNCIRNISTDQFAGVAQDEIEDPRPYAEILRQWSTFHPEFSYLPRKFKIALTGATRDRAAVAFHDMAFRCVRNEAGDVGFQVLVGGGMGRTPIVAKVIREFIPKRYLLAYAEAIMRVYNSYGRRDNIYKARIKILVQELGIEKFRQEVDEDFEKNVNRALELEDSELERMQAFFKPPAYRSLPATDAAVDELLATDKRFKMWYDRNVDAHKVPGYAIVTFSLKVPGVAPGDATTDQMYAIADLADEFSFGELRTTFKQNLVLADVERSRLPELWEKAKALSIASPTIETLTDIIACPGLDYCSLANARSIPIAQKLIDRFDDIDFVHDLGDLRLNISGCINACGHHHAGNIGILGVDKKGEEFYQVTLGGSPEDDASVGKIMGPAFSEHDIVPAVEKVIEVFLAHREPDERFLDCYRRIGMEPFKERVYADH
ncbi:nitrite/sulfite reductase [Iodidimonas sp. SYSU 1G8]|uniref:nitrite/sulfite reductase n=1 Tax=Iodidimonas sp. SYSU 1G8 TaxID=3133967 RepID=UPI0031FEFAF5